MSYDPMPCPPYSPEVRWALIELIETGVSQAEAARRVGIAPGSVYAIIRRWRKTGLVRPGKNSLPAIYKGRRGPLRWKKIEAESPPPETMSKSLKLGAITDKWMSDTVTAEPAITLRELKNRLASRGVRVHEGTIQRRLYALGFRGMPAQS